MTVATLRDVIADLLLEHAEIRNEYGEDPSVENPDYLADLIIKRIQETHSISERSPASDHPSVPAPVKDTWAGQVDRQSGAFTDQEIADSYTWR